MIDIPKTLGPMPATGTLGVGCGGGEASLRGGDVGMGVGDSSGGDVGVTIGDAVGDEAGVAVAVGDAVGLAVGVAVGVDVGVPVIVGVGVAIVNVRVHAGATACGKDWGTDGATGSRCDIS